MTNENESTFNECLAARNVTKRKSWTFQDGSKVPNVLLLPLNFIMVDKQFDSLH